jgi:hypothetical protein
MGADVYDWKAPTAQAAPQPYSTVNMEAAQAYNRRVPTAAATANVPMPSVATPAPNVPTPEYIPTMPGMEGGPTMDPNYLAPQAPVAQAPVAQAPVAQAPVAQAPVTSSPAFTPVTNPLGPTPEDVRRSGAAAELDALKAREEQERVAREAEAKRISDLELAERQRQEQLNLISLENARVRDLRLAEEKRLADENAAAEQLRIANENAAAEQVRIAEEKRIAEQQRAEAAKRVEAYIAEAPSGATGFSDYSLIGGGDDTETKDFRSFTSFDDLRSNPLAFDPGSRSLAYTTRYDPGGDNSPTIFEVGPDTSWYSSDGGPDY